MQLPLLLCEGQLLLEELGVLCADVSVVSHENIVGKEYIGDFV